MSKTWLAFVAVGLCWGCHPNHKKPKKPPHLEMTVSNDCDEAVTVVVGADPETSDTIDIPLEPREAIVWTPRDGEMLWSRDDDDAEWIAAPVENDGEGSTVVSTCISTRLSRG
jgi:hypothetical protein